MSMRPEFEPFKKIPRLNRGIVITEKIDGTNASVTVTDAGEIFAASRTRWVTPGNDNYDFGAWVYEHSAQLRRLGPGTHYGEWWGQGIQRKYGMDRKAFSLFNVSRWEDPMVRPLCCDVVPVLYSGPFNQAAIDASLDFLRENGSAAAPGFARPEGIVLFHKQANSMFKVTLEKDEVPKGAPAAMQEGPAYFIAQGHIA